MSSGAFQQFDRGSSKRGLKFEDRGTLARTPLQEARRELSLGGTLIARDALTRHGHSSLWIGCEDVTADA